MSKRNRTGLKVIRKSEKNLFQFQERNYQVIMASTGGVPDLGSKISLISKSEIRYEGIVYSIGTEMITLSKAKSGDEVYEYITFRSTDVKDIRICQPFEQHPTNPFLQDLSGSLPKLNGPLTKPGKTHEHDPSSVIWNKAGFNKKMSEEKVIISSDVKKKLKRKRQKRVGKYVFWSVISSFICYTGFLWLFYLILHIMGFRSFGIAPNSFASEVMENHSVLPTWFLGKFTFLLRF